MKCVGCGKIKGFLPGSYVCDECMEDKIPMEKLVAAIEKEELQEALDELIHQVHAGMASEINNQGVEGQLVWLKKNLDLAGGDVLKSIGVQS